ncbi:hypothetical protein JHK86_026184 [Glycine max]|nr:hypothetical protein JHK86_026184 [Glycine max]
MEQLVKKPLLPPTLTHSLPFSLKPLLTPTSSLSHNFSPSPTFYRFFFLQSSSLELLFIDFTPSMSITLSISLQATENSVYLDMLRLFAHGTWSDYKRMFARMKLKGIDGVHTSRGAFGLIRCKVKNLTRA